MQFIAPIVAPVMVLCRREAECVVEPAACSGSLNHP